MILEHFASEYLLKEMLELLKVQYFLLAVKHSSIFILEMLSDCQTGLLF